MIKTKMIKNSNTDFNDLDTKINDFIKSNNITVIIDIKFISLLDRPTALIIYKEEENA